MPKKEHELSPREKELLAKQYYERAQVYAKPTHPDSHFSPEDEALLAVQNYLAAAKCYEGASNYRMAKTIYREAEGFLKKNHVPIRWREEITEGLARLEPGQERKNAKASRLEKSATLVIAIAGLLGGIFFLSTNVTGNAIGNLTITNSSWIGGALFVVGVVGCLFWVKKRKFN